MNVIGLYGAIGWNVLISDNPKLLKQSEDSWNHGSSVTLIKDGEHCVSISEERLTKIKYDGNFPRKSIEYCLSAANLDKNDIDLVIVPSMANQQFYKNYINKTVEKKVRRYFPKARVEIASHHLCHAYSSVFSCDYNEGSFVTLDNAGSVLFDTSGQIFACENHSFGYFNKKKGLFKYYPGIPQTNNFGNYYWMWAYHIYVNKIQKDIQLTDPKYRETFCGKVMGLSAYGNIKEFKKDYRTHFEGIPQVALESFPGRDFNYGNLSPENKAKQLQYNFENAMLEYMKELKEKDYINDNLCLAGGVFLNILANSVLRKNKVVENLHIPPFPDDTGLSFGAAALGLFKSKEVVKLPHNISLLGKTYDESEIEDALVDTEYKKYDDFEKLCEDVAKLLADNKIVGWFQNRSEFGPRALGGRSIIGDPRNQQMQSVMNLKIKFRESFRPFAPSVLEEEVTNQFEMNYKSPYMLLVAPLKKELCTKMTKEQEQLFGIEKLNISR